jgi:outer membrane protein OmpA-like peptidoglycan-associated protein
MLSRRRDQPGEITMHAAAPTLVLAFFCSTSIAFAQEAAPQRSPDDFAKAIADAPCDNGQDRDQDGLCPSAEETTRGFNLGGHTSAAPAPRRQATPAAPRRAQVTPASLSSLADLRITFRSGSAEMTNEGRAEARSFAAALMLPSLSRRRFEIAGHTDASGSAEGNLALSQARAESVMNFLVANGVDRSRLQARGYGSEGLAVPSAPRDPANRRVEARSLN